MEYIHGVSLEIKREMEKRKYKVFRENAIALMSILVIRNDFKTLTDDQHVQHKEMQKFADRQLEQLGIRNVDFD
jgi:hypothetical protein